MNPRQVPDVGQRGYQQHPNSIARVRYKNGEKQIVGRKKRKDLKGGLLFIIS